MSDYEMDDGEYQIDDEYNHFFSSKKRQTRLQGGPGLKKDAFPN